MLFSKPPESDNSLIYCGVITAFFIGEFPQMFLSERFGPDQFLSAGLER